MVYRYAAHVLLEPELDEALYQGCVNIPKPSGREWGKLFQHPDVLLVESVRARRDVGFEMRQKSFFELCQSARFCANDPFYRGGAEYGFKFDCFGLIAPPEEALVQSAGRTLTACARSYQ